MHLCVAMESATSESLLQVESGPLRRALACGFELSQERDRDRQLDRLGEHALSLPRGDRLRILREETPGQWRSQRELTRTNNAPVTTPLPSAVSEMEEELLMRALVLYLGAAAVAVLLLAVLLWRLLRRAGPRPEPALQGLRRTRARAWPARLAAPARAGSLSQTGDREETR